MKTSLLVVMMLLLAVGSAEAAWDSCETGDGLVTFSAKLPDAIPEDLAGARLYINDVMKGERIFTELPPAGMEVLFDPVALDDGKYVVDARIFDDCGNESLPSPAHNLKVKTKKPPSPGKPQKLDVN